jgi:hypothetical protein
VEDIRSIESELAETNNIGFEAYHKPGIRLGKYSLQSVLDFSIGSIISKKFTSNSLEFEVSGPRFCLSPNDVYAMFPPRDSLGEYDNVLPHLELRRSTLPWERSADKGSTPWLCLILLQEDEYSNEQKVVVQSMPWNEEQRGLRQLLNLNSESADEPDDIKNPLPPVKVLKIEKNFLESILPTAGDVNWLTHVRVGHDQHGEKFERAVVVCNRLSRPGSRAEVHLISLEDRFTDNGFDFKRGQENEKVPLLSLLSWQFNCPDTEEFKVSEKAIDRLSEELRNLVSDKFNNKEVRDTLFRGKEEFIATLKAKEIISDTEGDSNNKNLSQLLSACHIQTETFKGLMDALDMGWMRIKPQIENAFFQAGSIPVAHGLRSGGKTVTWYRGPLIATPNFGGLSCNFPARHADQLLFYDESTGMLDASYAASWELGRLLTIGQPRISQQIAHWKTSHAREVGLARQNLNFGHIPFTEAGFVHEKDGQLDRDLQHYFEELSLLKGVPFHYLVPNEKLLPHESLRFFYLDNRWIDALLDGAFSIGRTTRLDTTRVSTAASSPMGKERPALTGILLRSDLVSGWPSLLVEGYQDNENSRLPVRRFERIGPNVLLVLFEGTVKQLKIHLPAESLHFGFNQPTEEGKTYFKELKSLEDGSEIMLGGKNVTCDICWKGAGSRGLRIFDPSAFVAAMNKSGDMSGGLGILHAGQFAVELLEGVPCLSVRIN